MLPPPTRTSLRALHGVLDLVLDLFGDGLVVLARLPEEDAGDLDDADDAEEEVDGGQQVVLGLDDEAPAGPDEAGGGQGTVLGEGEFLGGAGEVGDAGEDEGPLLVFICASATPTHSAGGERKVFFFYKKKQTKP